METRARRRERRQRMYNLDTMPQVAMEQILKYCDFMEINALRKTCTYTRRLVDLIKPDLGIGSFRFYFSSDAITMRHYFGKAIVLYKNTVDGCSVSIDGRASSGKCFKDTTAAEMFCRDFKILLPMLMHQKTPFDYWRLYFEVDGFAVFQTTMGRVLAEFNAQLRTEHFILCSEDCLDLTALLPLVCAKTLTRLSIANASIHVDEVLDLSQVAELAQWKSIRRLRLDYCRPDTLSRLQQFSDSYVSCRTVTPDDFVSLKEALRNAPLLNECTIKDYGGRDWNEVNRAMSPRDSNASFWYFSTTTPEFVLSVEFTRLIQFKRIPRSSLKHDDVVMD